MNATDADTKPNKLHKELQNHLSLTNDDDFDTNVEKLKYFHKALPVSDLLHLLINVKKNTENLVLFGQNRRFQFFILLFVEVLILTVIQAKKLSIECRINLCKICYECITNLHEHRFSKQRSNKKGESIVSFLENNTYQLNENNLLCYAFEFKYYGKELSTDTLSSHPLELTFGDIRQSANGNDTSEMAIHCVTKSIIRDELMSQYGKNVSPTRGRSYIAGSFFDDGWVINLPEDINVSLIKDEIISIVNEKLSFEEFEQRNSWKHSIFLRENANTIVPNISGNNSGTRIIDRYHNNK